MDSIEELVDERNKSWCIYCGGWINDGQTNVDHIPSKVLLLKPFPPNLPVITVHKSCNEGFSLDEEYLFLFLSSLLSGTTEPAEQVFPKAGRALKRNSRLRAQIERSKKVQEDLFGEAQIIWQPEWGRISRVVQKNACGHAFYEYGEPMLEKADHIQISPLVSLTPEQKQLFEDGSHMAGWPEVGSRMMTRVMTGQDLKKGWVVVQEGVYRYTVTQHNGMTVRTVLHEYLATEVVWDS